MPGMLNKGFPAPLRSTLYAHSVSIFSVESAVSVGNEL